MLGKHRCLVDKHGSYVDWKNALYREYEKSGAHALIGKFHDNRASFACDQYKKLTGKPAPVVAGRRLVSKEKDKAAREVLSKFLGHSRISVAAQYVGSAQ
ncbi:hypothetical protein J8L98_13370 [Pseudoalteromonas sp. MMG013]|uniref:hypothetical protein n=1 Tax=Pseudoalteromonas sp. MMG013 TaxID=2822687 RepID=UPI001B366F6A|nr:hypothetical protein [Pseudoalteromonas sp. MMG013]MBQ4862680.1 hypothetical protein [Pseudoalteromonas sp. MMG013]